MKTEQYLTEYLRGTGLDEPRVRERSHRPPGLPEQFFAPAWEPEGIPEGAAAGSLTGQELIGLLSVSLGRGDIASASVAGLRAELVSITRRLGVYEQWLAERNEALAAKDQALAASDRALQERKRELRHLRDSTTGRLVRVGGRLSREGRRVISGLRRGG